MSKCSRSFKKRHRGNGGVVAQENECGGRVKEKEGWVCVEAGSATVCVLRLT